MVDVRVICAIGKHGQLGLNGRLPWEGNPGTEYKADVQRFFALTRGHVVIAGPRTIASFPDWARSERTLVEYIPRTNRMRSSRAIAIALSMSEVARQFGRPMRI